MSEKYVDFFNIDNEYFPQINVSSINVSPELWKKTYPHEKFIEMLKAMVRSMERLKETVNGRKLIPPLWIEGSYGTGKSQCAYALLKILEVPEAELRQYWDSFEQLKKQQDLLERILFLKQKDNGIVMVHRYSIGGIDKPSDLYFAVQSSIEEALKKRGLSTGTSTLKEGIIEWISQKSNKEYFNNLLKEPEYSSLFSQSTADEVIEALQKGNNVQELVANIIELGSDVGIIPFKLDVDKLITWIKNVISENKIQLVLIWDEFSEYFRNNRDHLSDFQKLVEIVDEIPFYFVVITHESGQMFHSNEGDGKKLSSRFKNVTIELPDNIAFDLIAAAFKVSPQMQELWKQKIEALDSRLGPGVTNAVIEASKITNKEVVKGILPLHPMAALLLKHITTAFQSNQRSLFGFIKADDDVKGFQWFIQNYGPLDGTPLLTIDLLWDFFYEKCKNNLTPDIRSILDTYAEHEKSLQEQEQIVLKTVLIMQAIDKRHGGVVDLFKVTDQNITYAFAGTSLEKSCITIIKGLVEKRLLVVQKVNNKQTYGVAVFAGDSEVIEQKKDEILKTQTTKKLVEQGELSTKLGLSPALRSRFESEPKSGKIKPITLDDCTKTLNDLRDKELKPWQFRAVIAFAKDDQEAGTFRKKIRELVESGAYQDIVFIDALSTPLGREAFEEYADYSASAEYYRNKNKGESEKNAKKAEKILDQGWSERINSGKFVIYTASNTDGKQYGGMTAVNSALQAIVLERFPAMRDFDFAKGVSETQLDSTQVPSSAKYGVLHQKPSGRAGGLEKFLLSKVWSVDRYWETSETSELSISLIKKAVDEVIAKEFSSGHVAMNDICTFLSDQYGFAPNNLTAFITGFLLKEYSDSTYRYGDADGLNESMTPEKLANMIANCLSGKDSRKPTYIVKMTPEERAFYDFSWKVWGIESDISTPDHAISQIQRKMGEKGLPVWCLSEVDEDGVFYVIQKYIDLLKTQDGGHALVQDIGAIAMEKPELAEPLSRLVTKENCQKGMRQFLRSFKDGKILDLAEEIEATENVLADVQKFFEQKHSNLWEKETGEDEICKLLTDYGFVKMTNVLQNIKARSRSEAFNEWRRVLKYLKISNEALSERFHSAKKVIDFLLKIYQDKQDTLSPAQFEDCLSEMEKNQEIIREWFSVRHHNLFETVYSQYLEDVSPSDISKIVEKVAPELFGQDKTSCNRIVAETVDEFLSSQLKNKLNQIWKDKSGTQDPREWSERNQTPILCCVSKEEFNEAQKAFGTFRSASPQDTEIQEAIAFLEKTKLFDVLSDKAACDEAFTREIVGKYIVLLPDIKKIRDKLRTLPMDVYDWYHNRTVQERIEGLAKAEYDKGGNQSVLDKIDKLNNEQLRQYLKKLVCDNLTVGIEIILDKSE